MGSVGAQALGTSLWEDADKDRRSGRQIIESAIGYCEWQANKGHSGQLTRAMRENPSRWWYLGGLGLLTDILYSREVGSFLLVVDPFPFVPPPNPGSAPIVC